MNRITITEQDGASRIEADVKTTEAKYLGILLDAYREEAMRLIHTHKCDNPDCAFEELHRELIATICSVLNMHELKHPHA